MAHFHPPSPLQSTAASPDLLLLGALCLWSAPPVPRPTDSSFTFSRSAPTPLLVLLHDIRDLESRAHSVLFNKFINSKTTTNHDSALLSLTPRSVSPDHSSQPAAHSFVANRNRFRQTRASSIQPTIRRPRIRLSISNRTQYTRIFRYCRQPTELTDNNVAAVSTAVRLVADGALNAPSVGPLCFASRKPSPDHDPDGHWQPFLDMSLTSIPPHKPRSALSRRSTTTHHSASISTRATAQPPASARAATSQAAPTVAQDGQHSSNINRRAARSGKEAHR